MWKPNMMNSLSDALLTLQNAMERTMNEDYFGCSTTSQGSYPLINLFEKDGDYALSAELPGVPKENIKIEIKGEMLRIAGKRDIDYEENISYHRKERKAFQFDRSIKLPFRVDEKNVNADFKDGILYLSLPRAEADKPKQISIN